MTLITLQVGERRYFSEEKTLVEGSTYFKTRLTGSSKDDKEVDGSHFIDRDGLLFEHILSFLRTGICPLFRDSFGFYDCHKYQRLSAEAKFFGVKKLHDWLIASSYQKVITTTRHVNLIENLEDLDNVAASDKAQIIPMWRTRKTYLCPRGIQVHRGKPESCGRACEQARVDYGQEYDEEQELVAVHIWYDKVFHNSVLIP